VAVVCRFFEDFGFKFVFGCGRLQNLGPHFEIHDPLDRDKHRVPICSTFLELVAGIWECKGLGFPAVGGGRFGHGRHGGARGGQYGRRRGYG
jgi:hypothetical protein